MTPNELKALAELADRCEREEASRELERDIFQAIGGPRWDDAYAQAQEPCGCPHGIAVFIARHKAPRFGTSPDAAVSLVPEGMVAAAIHYVPQLDPKMPASGVARVYSDDLESGRYTGRTAALALCAAALRARAALAGDGAPADPPKVRE